MSLPGVDSTTASALVAARPIEDMREVDEVLASSLSEDQREQVYSRLWKKIDLNTATPEEIMLIPEMTERMRGEFEEYRPYTSMERFRTEIGKYVDQAEVARLEQYVEIR